MKKIKITEQDIHHIVKECVQTIINEKRNLSSQKLYDILQQHDGFNSWQREFPKHWNLTKQQKHQRRRTLSHNFSNLTDEDVAGVLTRKELQDIQYQNKNGLELYIQKQGLKLDPRFDEVSYAELQDGTYLIYIDRNSHGYAKNMENNPNKKEGDWFSYYNKRNERRFNQQVDGKNSFKPMSDKAQAARELRRNPYYWNHEGGWKDPNRRKQGMENVKQGNDASGGPVWRNYNGQSENDKGSYEQQYGKK